MILDRITAVLAVLALCLITASTAVYAKGRPTGDRADTKAPSSSITNPTNGDLLVMPQTLASYSIQGTASDGNGKGSGVQGVEVSTDDGFTWYAASDISGDGTWKTWSYKWAIDFTGKYTLKSRARDNAGNIESPGRGVSVTVTR